MKKVLFVLAIATTSLVACNNSTDTSATTSADSARIADSIKAATPAPAPDTTAKKIDSAASKIDTAAKKIDTATKKM